MKYLPIEETRIALPLPLGKNCFVDDFDFYNIFNNFPILKRRRTAKRKLEKHDVLDCVCAFDIESTNIGEIEQAVMYVWQFQIENEITVFGRTWEEFKIFIENIVKVLPENTDLIVYVHNLSYEFQFLKGVFDFESDDIFATDLRKILYCRLYDSIEFRCSYRMSNLSLKDFTRKYKVKHQKLSDYDYNIPRYYFSGLTIEELRYCQNDVLGLVEAIHALLLDEKCNLLNVSLTSTGFIRKELKKIVSANLGYNYAKPFFPSSELYQLLRRAFRGGDTHCNRYYVNDVLEDLNSVDRSSSYPDVLCNYNGFPIEPLAKVEAPNDIAYIEKLIYQRKRAVLMEVRLTNVHLRNEFYGDLYLSKDKSDKIVNGVFYNGRIISADSLECVLTDIDYRIIKKIYSFDVEILSWYKSRSGKIPRCMIDFIIEQYKYKTSLKGVAGELNETLYMKSKNRLNGIYGLFRNCSYTERNHI